MRCRCEFSVNLMLINNAGVVFDILGFYVVLQAFWHFAFNVFYVLI